MLDGGWWKLCGWDLLWACGSDWTINVSELWLAKTFSWIVISQIESIARHCQTLPNCLEINGWWRLLTSQIIFNRKARACNIQVLIKTTVNNLCPLFTVSTLIWKIRVALLEAQKKAFFFKGPERQFFALASLGTWCKHTNNDYLIKKAIKNFFFMVLLNCA